MKTKKETLEKVEQTASDRPKTILGAVYYRAVSDVLEHGIQAPLQRAVRVLGIMILILVLSFPSYIASGMIALSRVEGGRLQTLILLSIAALFWPKIKNGIKKLHKIVLDEYNRVRTIQYTGHRFEGIPVRDLIDFLLSSDPFGRDVFEFLFRDFVAHPREVHAKLKEYLLEEGILVRAKERDNAIVLNPEIGEAALIEFFRRRTGVLSRGEQAPSLPSFTIRTIHGEIMSEPHPQGTANQPQTE